MGQYKGVTCPVCTENFEENDDVVVCPDCGTPHHRHCYFENGTCMNERLHSSGYSWKSPLETAIQGYIAVEEMRQKQLDEREQQARQDGQLGEFLEILDRAGFPRDKFEELEETFDEQSIYGVSEREISVFQGVVNPLALERYRRMGDGESKVSFNLFAGILAPYYQFYMRQTAIGAILMILNNVLSLPYSILVLIESGMLGTFAGDISINTQLLQNFYSVAQVVGIVIMLVMAIFGDYIYLRWMANKIVNIRSRYEAVLANNSALPQEYYSELRASGKPSFLKMLVNTAIVYGAMLIVALGALYMFFLR